MAKRREFNVFSLAFLDIMSCGFGAVILIYIIINHGTENTSQELNITLLAQVKLIEERVENEQQDLIVLRNTLTEVDETIVTTANDIIELLEMIRELETLIAQASADQSISNESIEELKTELKRLEQEAINLKGSVAGNEQSGSALRSVVGQGDRQYLTGLKIGGQRILILLDASASMLDETIVNIIRRRNLPTEQQLASEKWQRAIRTVEWITANMPQDAQFQVVTFNTQSQSAIPNSASKWFAANNPELLNSSIEGIKSIVPAGGTSLHAAFTAARTLSPEPDNIFLIVDGLPTQGKDKPRGSVASSRDRLANFSSAIEGLPNLSPINIILFPMEGDPVAAPSYWRLAQMTGGSFLAPSRDWP